MTTTPEDVQRENSPETHFFALMELEIAIAEAEEQLAELRQQRREMVVQLREEFQDVLGGPA